MKHLDTIPAVLCLTFLATLCVSLGHAKPPARPAVVTTIEEPAAYVAEPLYPVYHRPTCFCVNPKHALLSWTSETAARDSGRHPCEHCLSQRLAQAR